jgi:alpha-mannosidase
MQKKIGFVFSHTHWDLEWYQPGNAYRFWLIQLMDRLISLCRRNPQFKTFVLDGQVMPVEIYLAVKPEKERMIRRLVRRGKLALGPFYTQCDEWLVSPEAIVRNCLAGNRRARQYGGVMKAGYLPDNFGHPSQLPQIMAGFGIESVIFMRGMPDRPPGLKDQFNWQGMDGTSVMAVHLSKGYGNAYACGADWHWGLPFRTVPYGDYLYTQEYFIEAAATADITKGMQALLKEAHALVPECPSGVLPLANGTDHALPQEYIPQMIAQANQTQKDIEFIQGDCAEMTVLIKKTGVKLPAYSGELYGARYSHILNGTLSTRAYLKQANFAAEALLEKYAEPLSVSAALLGRPYPRVMLEEAWRLLFLNHAHDGIHGSSVDPVHVEMMQRSDGARQIAVSLCHAALHDVGARMLRPGDQKVVLVYNPVGAPANDHSVVDTWLHAPEAFHIVDDQGRAVPMQVVSPAFGEQSSSGQVSVEPPWPYGRPAHIVFTAPLKSYGLSAFAVAPGLPAGSPGQFRNTDKQIENEYLKVFFKNGALDVWHKESRTLYRGLNIIEEEADAGDAWDFSEPWKPHATYCSADFPSTCRLVENGPVRAAWRIETMMRVPGELCPDQRSRERVPLKLIFTVSLARGARCLEVVLQFDNLARDHRLRLKCPTGIVSARVKSQGQFAVMERAVQSKLSGRNWIQPPPVTYPFREWVAVDDGCAGLAIAGRGLYEYEARPEKQRVSLYLTLLRGIGRMTKSGLKARPKASCVLSPEIPGAQCLGAQRFEYAFIPYRCRENPSKTPFLAWARGFLFPPIAHVLREPRSVRPVQNDAAGLFSLAPANLCVSCFKGAEDEGALILRFWENEGKQTMARLVFSAEFKKIVKVNLNEEPLSLMKMDRCRVHLAVEPYQIVTLKLYRQK